MDPVTAGFNFATMALTLLREVRADLPEDIRKRGAVDAADLVHNIAVFGLEMQAKINAFVK